MAKQFNRLLGLFFLLLWLLGQSTDFTSSDGLLLGIFQASQFQNGLYGITGGVLLLQGMVGRERTAAYFALLTGLFYSTLGGTAWGSGSVFGWFEVNWPVTLLYWGIAVFALTVGLTWSLPSRRLSATSS